MSETTKKKISESKIEDKTPGSDPQTNTTTDLPRDFSTFSEMEQYYDPFVLMEEILEDKPVSDLDSNSNELQTENSIQGFHFQPEGSVIKFFCEL